MKRFLTKIGVFLIVLLCVAFVADRSLTQFFQEGPHRESAVARANAR